MNAFPFVERYLSLRLACALAGVQRGSMAVVETPLRLQREMGYGYVRVLWWQRLDDGRSVLSLPPGASLVLGAPWVEVGLS